MVSADDRDGKAWKEIAAPMAKYMHTTKNDSKRQLCVN